MTAVDDRGCISDSSLTVSGTGSAESSWKMGQMALFVENFPQIIQSTDRFTWLDIATLS